MYLAELTVKNFRKLRDAKLKFQPGLNVLVRAFSLLAPTSE